VKRNVYFIVFRLRIPYHGAEKLKFKAAGRKCGVRRLDAAFATVEFLMISLIESVLQSGVKPPHSKDR
jgi:hypothetical protein